MASVAVSKVTVRSPKLTAWLPLVILPVAVSLLAVGWPSWVFMWVLAISIYAGLKWLTFTDYAAANKPTLGRSLAYLILWPGMAAKSFFASSKTVKRPLLGEWFFAIGKSAFGLSLIIVAAYLVVDHPMIAGWVGMIGIAFTLHFGLFHLLSVIWRQAGIDAKPVMNAPILASSISDFWGKRWNLAFRDLAHTYVFRPSIAKLGIAGATIAVFLVSGIIHDIVISLPAKAGFGLPTLYFLIQGIGLLFERSWLGKRLRMGKGLVGRIFCAAVVLGPILLLLHRPFVERVVVPMLAAIGRVRGEIMNLELLILLGGVLHFGILIASASVPKVLEWKASLNKLDGLSRQLVWVHGVFIVLVIIGFGTLSILFAGDLVTGTPLARGVCLFIALFWAARLIVQFFVFDAKPYLKTPLLKAGYHGLTLVFIYHAVVYSLAAFLPA